MRRGRGGWERGREGRREEWGERESKRERGEKVRKREMTRAPSDFETFCGKAALATKCVCICVVWAGGGMSREREREREIVRLNERNTKHLLLVHGGRLVVKIYIYIY